MPESEKPKPNVSAAPKEPTPFQKFQALASALVKVSPSELSKKEEEERKNIAAPKPPTDKQR